MLSLRKGTVRKRKSQSISLSTAAFLGLGLLLVVYFYTREEDAYVSRLIDQDKLLQDIRKEGDAVKPQAKEDIQRELPSSVVCGGHTAPKCELCPQGNGESWCNGECTWCASKTECIHQSAVCEKPKEGEMQWKAPDPEPWFVPPEKDYGLTISVVLPCGHEHEFFERTVRSVFAATPPKILKEIIVVDDNSFPPLQPLFTLNPDEYKVKFLRSDVTLGLMDAKHQGAKLATGDIVVFFDCHVKPALGYWEPFVREIAANPKRVVVPTITALDINTWVESGRPRQISGGMSKCYLTFDSEFKWTNDDTPWIPIMSGGLLALRRDWFFEVGGHDPEMKGWGGENLDLSLRIWRCGGSIVSAPRSYVAHMWRMGGKTRAKYKIEGSPLKNRARAIKAHAPEFFGNKTVYFPAFGQWRTNDNLDVHSIQDPLEHLQCRDFLWYLDYFSYIYRDAGYIPSQVFQLTPDGGKHCLSLGRKTWGTASTPQDKLVLQLCSDVNGREATSGTQYWHKSNRDGEGKCCSGLRAWNTDQCMLGGLQTGICSMNPDQPAALNEQGQLVVAHACIVVKDDPPSLAALNCAAADGFPKWELHKPFEPQEFSLLSQDMKNNWN